MFLSSRNNLDSKSWELYLIPLILTSDKSTFVLTLMLLMETNSPNFTAVSKSNLWASFLNISNKSSPSLLSGVAVNPNVNFGLK